MEEKISGKDTIKSAVANLPEKPGIYRMYDITGKILYIGKARNIKKRVTNYTKLDLTTRILRMVFLTAKLEITVTGSEAEALLLEASLIKKFQPRFNILLKDDKSYPYIKFRFDHDFPQILKYRGKNLSDGKFFGPFASAKDVDKTIEEMNKIFKIRPCSDNYFSSRKRACLQYQIKRCTAPCVGKISKDEYAQNVKQAEAFLLGKSNFLQGELSRLMYVYSEDMQFEKAAEIRDRIKALNHIQARGLPAEFQINNADIIAAYEEKGEFCVQVYSYRAGQSYGNKAYFPIHSEGSEIKEVLSSFIGQFYQTRPAPEEIIINLDIEDKEVIKEALQTINHHKVTLIIPQKGNKLKIIEQAIENAKVAIKDKLRKTTSNTLILEKIKDVLDLKEIPQKIEVYDNSHIFGRFAVGAMIVAGPEGFNKNLYRRYTIDNARTDKPITGGDDYAMLEEVLSRRFKRIKDGSNAAASLMIIDGGRGHLTRVKQVLEKYNLDIPFVCMSKGPNRNAGEESFHMPGREIFTLEKDDPAMRYLQILRDEAHNFAIKSHRIKRSKSMSSSALDQIKNIGPARKKALLEFFGSVEGIKNASINDIMKVGKINNIIAEEIYKNFHD